MASFKIQMAFHLFCFFVQSNNISCFYVHISSKYRILFVIQYVSNVFMYIFLI